MNEKLNGTKQPKTAKKKYLVRVAQTLEAEQDIKEYENSQTRSDLPSSERDRSRRDERHEGFL